MLTVVINTPALIFDVLSNPYVCLQSSRLAASEIKCPRFVQETPNYVFNCNVTQISRSASVVYDFGINLRLVEWSDVGSSKST